MLLLAIDTATPAMTVAVSDGTVPLAQETVVDARRHGELLAPSVARVLAEASVAAADLTGIAVGTGPGPYTGLRAGLITARVLASSLGIRADGICTLDVLAAAAAAAAAGREFIVATDARRKEVYWARYSPLGDRLSGPHVTAPGEVPAGYPVAGEGPVLYPELADQPIGPRYPSAAVLAHLAAGRLAAGLEPGPPEPLYLRRPDAMAPGRPKRVTPR